MSNSPIIHSDILVLGQQKIMPTDYCTAGAASASGGIGVLAGPIFCGQPLILNPTAVVNIVPSPLSVPGGNALNISSDGLGVTPYTGLGIVANSATGHFIMSTLESAIVVNPTNILCITPTITFITNEISVGSKTHTGADVQNGAHSQNGASAKTGAKADAAPRVEAGPAVQNVTLVVSSEISGPTIARLESQIAAAAASPPKGFDMHHPTKPGWRLTHICLEGPEAAVYYRGRLKDSNYIELPDYWRGLVDPETITVQLTPHGNYQELYYEVTDWGTKIKVSNNASSSVDCSYVVYGERKDVDKIIVEYEGKIEDYPGKDQRSIVGYHYDYRPGLNS